MVGTVQNIKNAGNEENLLDTKQVYYNKRQQMLDLIEK